MLYIGVYFWESQLYEIVNDLLFLFRYLVWFFFYFTYLESLTELSVYLIGTQIVQILLVEYW